MSVIRLLNISWRSPTSFIVQLVNVFKCFVANPLKAVCSPIFISEKVLVRIMPEFRYAFVLVSNHKSELKSFLLWVLRLYDSFFRHTSRLEFDLNAQRYQQLRTLTSCSFENAARWWSEKRYNEWFSIHDYWWQIQLKRIKQLNHLEERKQRCANTASISY